MAAPQKEKMEEQKDKVAGPEVLAGNFNFQTTSGTGKEGESGADSDVVGEEVPPSPDRKTQEIEGEEMDSSSFKWK